MPFSIWPTKQKNKDQIKNSPFCLELREEFVRNLKKIAKQKEKESSEAGKVEHTLEDEDYDFLLKNMCMTFGKHSPILLKGSIVYLFLGKNADDRNETACLSLERFSSIIEEEWKRYSLRRFERIIDLELEDVRESLKKTTDKHIRHFLMGLRLGLQSACGKIHISDDDQALG